MLDTWWHGFRTFLTPPTFENDDETRIAAILNIILLLLLLITLTAAVGMIFDPVLLDYWPIIVVVPVMVVIERAVLRRGHLRAACQMMVCGVWTLVTVACYTDTGLYSITVIGYTVVIIMAGILIDGRSALVVSGLSILAAFGMYLMWNAGIMVAPPNYFDFAFNVWLIYAAIFAAYGVLIWGISYTVEHALVNARQRTAEMQRFFDLSLDGLIIADNKGYFTRLNPAFAKMLGYTEEVLKNRPFIEFVHPDDVEATRAEVQKLLRGLPTIQFHNRYRMKDGNYKWLSWSAHTDWSVTYAVVRDVTEQRQSEEALRRRESLLKEMGAVARVGGWEIDVLNNVLTWTEQVYHIHEMPLDYQPTVEQAINFYAPEFIPIIRAAVERGLATGEGWDLELDIITGKGSRVAVRALGQPEFHDGQVVRLFGAFQDISQRKQAEQVLRDQQAQQVELTLAQEKAQFLSQFLVEIGEITHDLKMPLSVINTSLYFLERPIDESARHERILRIQEQTTLMTRYIQNILAISQLERAEHLELTPINLSVLASSTHADYRAQIERKGLTVTVNVAENAIIVNADQNQLYRAMANLVENAIHYTPDGGTVEISAHQREDAAIFSVTDTGVGIEPAEQALIFERFFRGSNVRSGLQTGTGLGLAIVRKIVEMHGGTIEVNSIPGEGSTFTLRVPLVEEPAKA